MEESSVTFKPIRSKSVVDGVIDSLTEAILTRQFKPGDRIPTEDKLAGALGVARNSVREAVKVLVSLGVLEIRRAEGTFVAEKYSERMFNPVLYGMIVADSGLRDLIELRRVFEEGVIQLAIEKGTPEDMEKIAARRDAFIDQLKQSPVDCETLLQCDIAFHQSIEDAAHNALLPNMGRVITRLTIPSRRETMLEGIEAGQTEYFIKCHWMLADIVLNRQSGLVLEAINYHYNMWRKRE